LVVSLVTGGCKGNDSTMDYPKQVTVENTMVFDSVHATLKIRNRSSEPIELDIFPECDCTRATPEHVTVKPHRGEEINVSFWISSAGAFERILYLQRDNAEEPDTVFIKGYADK